MRQLTGFRINRSGAVDSYIFEWVNKNDAGAMESYTYKGIEPPRPELLTAADNIALISAKMVSLSLMEKDVMDGGCFYGLKMEYPVDADYYKLQIKASVQIPWGYTFKYETPNWRVWYSNTKGDFNNYQGRYAETHAGVLEIHRWRKGTDQTSIYQTRNGG